MSPHCGSSCKPDCSECQRNAELVEANEARATLLALAARHEAEEAARPKFAVYFWPDGSRGIGPAWLVDDCAQGAFSPAVEQAKWFDDEREAGAAVDRLMDAMAVEALAFAVVRVR